VRSGRPGWIEASLEEQIDYYRASKLWIEASLEEQIDYYRASKLWKDEAPPRPIIRHGA
jgi:hypothetical protein